MTDPPSEPDLLDRLAHEFAERCRRGEWPALTEYADRHPDLAAEIRELFPTLAAMEALGSSGGPGPPVLVADPPARLGEYRILRELGRGGMGVVYEAVQESLGRHVALKVLPDRAGIRGNALERFKREARAAANLHHTSIVPVFGVGEADGVHYYAMQFIPGQGLDAVLDELRRLRDQAPGSPARSARTASLAANLASGRFPAPVADPADPMAATRSGPVRAGSTVTSGGPDLAGGPAAGYFRAVARLGAQVADALAYAHGQGVIHRDVKPSNLLLDAHGTLWVTDFGLAQVEGAGDLTGPGDVVGTVRYMAPERFAGKADARSDVYGLGLTLYELLTLRPAFDDPDRLRLIDRIRAEDPPRPRSIDPRIPRDLEVIVRKATARDPGDRYESAAAFALDLQRYLNDEPVRACRPSAAYRFRKFARRNKAGVTAASVVVLALLSAVAALGVAVRTLAVSNARTGAALDREKDAREGLAQAFEREQQALYLHRIASAAREVPGGNLGLAERLLDECPPERRGWEWHVLKRRRYEGPRDLPHPVAVLRVAYSPDGRYLASGCLDGSVTVWDRRTGRRLPGWERAPEAHRAHVYGLAFSPDSRHLASGGSDGRVLVWDVDTGGPRHRLDGHSQAVTQLAFRPGGAHLASAGEDGTVRLWDLGAGQGGLTLRGHQGAVRGVAFSAEGQLISAGADGEVRVWDPDTGAMAASFRGRTRWASTLALHPDSGRLALASRDGNVELWDALSAGETRTLRGHTAEITSLAFSPDGRRLVTAGDDKLLKVWDAPTGQEAITFDIDRTPVGVAFSPDGHELACGYSRPDPVLRLWNGTPLSAGEGNDRALNLTGHDDPVVRVAFSPDGRHLASASRDGTAKVYSAVTGQETLTFRGHDAIVCAVAFSSNGRRVASGGWDERVLVWDAATGQVLQTLSGGAGFVYDVAFSPDGGTIASAHSNGAVLLWDPATGHLLRPPIRAHPSEVQGIAFSPDGKLLATAGGRDHVAKIWTLATGEERTSLPDVVTRVWGVAFSPDGRSVAAAQGGYLTVWDAGGGKWVRSFHTESTRVSHLAFSPDSRWLASAGWDQTVRLWDAGTGQQVALLRGHAGPVLGVAFSPGGRRLASCGGYRGKGEIKIWDAAAWTANQPDSGER